MTAAPTPRPSASPTPRRLLYAIGAAGGLVGALLGGGTGTVTVPALDRLTRLPRSLIHGTVAMPNAAVALIGATAYAVSGRAVDVRVAVPMMIGGVVGVQAGAAIVRRAPERALRIVFVAVLVVAGVKLLLDGLGVPLLAGGSVMAGRAGVVVWGAGLVLGVVVGAWSAALGLGGGLLTVPALVVLFGAPMQTALGTSLTVMLPNAVLGILAHRRQGTADAALGARLAVGAVPGAVAGALVALALPARVLGLVFGVFTLTMASLEAERLVRASRRPAEDQEQVVHR